MLQQFHYECIYVLNLLIQGSGKIVLYSQSKNGHAKLQCLLSIHTVHDINWYGYYYRCFQSNLISNLAWNDLCILWQTMHPMAVLIHIRWMVVLDVQKCQCSHHNIHILKLLYAMLSTSYTYRKCRKRLKIKWPSRKTAYSKLYGSYMHEQQQNSEHPKKLQTRKLIFPLMSIKNTWESSTRASVCVYVFSVFVLGVWVNIFGASDKSNRECRRERERQRQRGREWKLCRFGFVQFQIFIFSVCPIYSEWSENLSISALYDTYRDVFAILLFRYSYVYIYS